MRASRLIVLLRAALGVAAAIAVAEGLFYVDPIRRVFCDRYRDNFFANTPPWDVADRWRMDAPKLGVRMRPHWKGDLLYPFGTVHFETNRDGFAFPDLPYEKPPGVFRIAMYGNSVLLSKEIPLEERIPTRLAELLTAQGFKVEVLSFAIDNTEMDNWLMYHRAFGKKYAPDVAVIVTPRGRAPAGIIEGDHLIQELPHATYGRVRELFSRLSIKVRLFTVAARVIGEFRYSHSVRSALTSNWAKREKAAKVEPSPPEVIAEDARLALRAWHLFAEEAKADGVQWVLAMWVQSPSTWNQTGSETLRYAELERLTKTEPQPDRFVPLFGNHLLDGRPESAWYIPRFNHFHGAGADEAARWLAPHVAEALQKIQASKGEAHAP